MAHNSPMVAILKKSTEEVDWTTPIRSAISHSYGEDPDNYATEYANLQRCRQDAVKGAGSDMTARDLLYKYFGQLELLELRFAEIRNRSDPEGLKRAFYYFRTREVVKFLVGIILAQATEVFFEKCTDEKKGNALVAKIASQTAFMYTSLTEEVKEFMGKGIFDRNWVTLLQIKAKYFTSVAQYYRALADSAAGKHGDALVRFTVAEAAAKEANRSASSFSNIFVTQMSPSLPSDAGSAILDLTKAHLALCTDKKNEAQRENDLIYNAVLPAAEALPQIDKATVATPITIQEVYATPEVQKVIGPDMFIRLIPLSVHESASVYSEEKAKLVRGEVEKADNAEVEVKSALESLGVKQGLARFKAIAEGGVGGEEEVPLEVRRWREDIAVMEERESVERLMGQLTKLKDSVKGELDGVSRELDTESRDCEAMRVKYDHLWTQEPSGSLTKSFRQELKSHLGSLDAAAQSDQQVVALWDSVKGEIRLLLSPQVEEVFRASTDGGGAGSESLLDLDVTNDAQNDEERTRIAQLVDEIEERLGRLNKIAHERHQVLKDLKEKVQADDVSHLLLLNRRNPGVENNLFAGELEKFKPYQQRLTATVHHEQVTIQEVSALWRALKDLAGRGPGAKKWEERERRKKDTIRRFSRARDGYMEVRDGIAKGLQFYNELTELTTVLRRNAKSFVSERTVDRERLAAELETQRRFSQSAASSPPPPPPPRPVQSKPTGLEASFASMNIQGRNGPMSPPPPAQSSWQSTPAPSAPQYPSPPHNSAFSSPPSSTATSPPPPPRPPQLSQQYPVAPQQSAYQPSYSQPQYGQPQQQPYSQPQHQNSYPPPSSQPQYGGGYQSPAPTAGSPFPPPPPPISYQSQYGTPPPPGQQQQQQTGYQYGMPPPPPPQQYGQYPQGYGR
ncbi:ALIX V-shaped domain binding to HIV-domain-containing protein [Fomitopsis serialis]|uniref:ALIX V-shaped domain binding to HIV-domain-containing protein n=1 Tax=Fomitopsis serialis TaxID=139415 RepID=UPI0020080339|nr:ALIX V-shaped domain binding to HIV-domain-containing protein [Neoantrodia serialis]KAH9914099.1 ALIX V-shaped domain binding to HIV-domain-containing protein [Neoantrodia serialis]